MPDGNLDSPRRRTVLVGIGTGLVAYSTGVSTVSADSHGDVDFVLDSVGSTAWVLVDADDGHAAQMGAENPTLTLQEGTRYTFENRGGSSHPLAFRDSAGGDLLSQSGDGEFEDDPDVDYVEDGDEVSFTLTPALAAEMATYICTFHGSMEGSIEVAGTTDEENGDETDDDSYGSDPGDDDDPEEDDDDQDEADDVEDTADEDEDDATADDDAPGFGPLAGAAGLGGLAAYAYRTLQTDPPTPGAQDSGKDT